jgi:hypothetical protein
VEARKIGQVVSGFVLHGSKRRVVPDYIAQNEVLGARKFRMDTLSDLAPQLRPGDALFKADVEDAYHHLRLGRCDRDNLLFRIAGRWFRPLAVSRTTVVYKVPPICCPGTTTTGTPHHFVLGPLRSAIYLPWGHSGTPGRCRTGGSGNSTAVWGTEVEATPHQDLFSGEARFKVARYHGEHPTAALPPVPVEVCQDLPSGQTILPEGNSAQEKMFPLRHSASLWTGKFGVPCGHRRTPAPADPLRLCKRRELKSASEAIPLHQSPAFAKRFPYMCCCWILCWARNETSCSKRCIFICDVKHRLRIQIE